MQPISLIYIPAWQQEREHQPFVLSGAEVLTAEFVQNPRAMPNDIVQKLDRMIIKQRQQGAKVGLIGHAIGGYYAAFMAEKHQLPAILINPIVKAYASLLLADLLEENADFENIQKQLQQLEFATTQPDSLMLMLQKGDLLQDFQQALNEYADCNQIVLNGGNHQFAYLQDWLQAMVGFFNRYYQRLSGG